MTRWEQIGEARVLHAGKGEWYNQPHDKNWDMGEDAQDLPSPQWHVEALRGSEDPDSRLPRIVIDVTEMSWLVSHDWGFLIRTSGLLHSRGGVLVLVAGERIMEAAKILQMEPKFNVVASVEEAL